MWALWIAAGLATWTVVGLAVGVVTGRMLADADRREPGGVTPRAVPARSPAVLPAPALRQAARRRVPMPAVALVLSAVAVALETTGYAVRLSGTRGAAAELLSMDAPGSLPRLFVAGVLLTAAAAAAAGAGRIPGRRTWWAAVALVAAGAGTVKAGGTVHAAAIAWLAGTAGPAAAVVISSGLAAAVVGGLWWLSRTERRDRRRVLGALAVYGVASVLLSAVSAAAGPDWVVTATFVEESGEALSAVALLTAVLLGVAPGRILPADWPLRRTADAETLDTVAPVVLHPPAR